ncbi:MAG: acyltransferase, partial [Planctomycetaceae bacterium]|nr:acyltransferase [Planctomycetaceae bacterium]
LRALKNRFWPTARSFGVGLDKHSPALDGVRGLAVLLVLMYDCLKLENDGFLPTLLVRKAASMGWIGVDLFFVLSGFLITGILLETCGRSGYWKSFLARRAVRIFPLYYATLIGTFFVVPWILWMCGQWRADHPVAIVHADQWYYWTYLQNWLFAVRGEWPAERVLNHFWSLAVEEQFYLVWPCVVALLSRRQLGRLCVALCVTALALRCWLLTHDYAGVSTYVMTITRMDSLCLGALLAIGLRDGNWFPRLARWLPLATGVLLLGVLGLDAVWPVLKSQAFGSYTIGHTLVGLVFAGLIGTLATRAPSHLLTTLFSFDGLRLLGKYSYAIYVFHRFAYALVQSFDLSTLPEQWHGWAIFAATLVVSLVFAKISWIVLEQPFLRLKRYAPRPDEVEQNVKANAGSSETEHLIAQLTAAVPHADSATLANTEGQSVTIEA